MVVPTSLQVRLVQRIYTISDYEEIFKKSLNYKDTIRHISKRLLTVGMACRRYTKGIFEWQWKEK